MATTVSFNFAQPSDTQNLRTLYPPIEPYEEGFLKVSEIHELHWEQSGNPKGNPVLVLHGGPGGGCEAYYRQYFDPTAYRIICHDQRGSGKSKPMACLEENTTWDLVADIEKLRVKLGVDKWVVFGGSWGACLALAYAESYPERVKALILRGIFTLRREELIWFYQSGANFIFPDAWDTYVQPIPEVERGDFMSAYYRRLTNDKDKKTQLDAATAWTAWEMATAKLMIDPKNIARALENPEFALTFARIECHYFVNGGFFKSEGQLINNAHILNNIPGTTVQGRYDVVCPAKSAWDLHRNWTKGELIMVPDAGHSMKEPGILSELVKACDKYKNI